MAKLTPLATTRAGVAPSFVSAEAGGDQVVNDGRTLLYFKNTGSEITVTIDSLVNDNYGNDNNAVVTVPATTGERIVGPFNPSRFNLNNELQITYSGVSGLTVGVLRLGDPG